MRVLFVVLAMLLWLPAATAAERSAPPPLPEPAKVEYYVANNDQPVGPLSLPQVEERIRKGQTKPDDLAWKTGLTDWAPARTLAELQQAFEDAPPPDAGFSKLMLGTWETTWQQEGWVMRLRVAYSPDGSFTGALINNPPGGQPVQTMVNGTWSILPLESDSFTLTIRGADGKTSNLTMRVIDDKTLETLGDRGIMRKVAM